MNRGRQPITEAGFLQEPLGEQYFIYARHTAASFVRDIELKWNPGRTGMSLDDLVMETVVAAIERTKQDYAKGLFRNEKDDSFKQFFWWRIKKAFFAKLDAHGQNHEEVDGKNKNAPYCYSAEKAEVLDESHAAKMRYVRRILDIVSKMSPKDQRLFYLKYQFSFSDEDYKMWETIGEQKHVKDPFTKMANLKYGLSENYAKKRISQIKADIIAQLNQSGHTQANYRDNTSVPTMLQSLTASRHTSDLGLDIESLSEAECRDILVELTY